MRNAMEGMRGTGATHDKTLPALGRKVKINPSAALLFTGLPSARLRTRTVAGRLVVRRPSGPSRNGRFPPASDRLQVYARPLKAVHMQGGWRWAD